ncbi:MAG: hypothetical protein RL329_4048 [Bacteroidota bacterium]|jgi:monoamine oxidase
MNKNTPLNPGMSDALELEVAIIGAGTSGLYSAYRLTGSGKSVYQNGRVQVFDMLNRLGGRLESVKLPGMDLVGELGGMRYMTSQKIITALIQDVFEDQMHVADFPMGDPSKLFMYLRKQRFLQNQWNVEQEKGKKWETRYHLNDDDLGCSADQLFNKVIYTVLVNDPWFVKNFDGKVIKKDAYNYEFLLTSRDWNEVKPNLTYNFPGSPYHNCRVNDIGFWNLLKDQVSEEGYTFLSTAGGYYSNTINWNAAEAFPYMVGDFSNAEVQFKTIAEGFDSIAYALANAYMATPKACIWSENKLLRFSKLTQAATHKYELIFLNLRSGTEWKVYANSIILAMPRRSLELLRHNNFFFNAKRNVQRAAALDLNIRSIVAAPAYKILMGFERAWWTQFGIDSGHSITDLPMRQCYYFGTDPKNGHSMLLGSYGDMVSQTFWKVLSDHPDYFQVKATRSVALGDLRALSPVQAKRLMVNEIMDELRELHGADIDFPYVTWYRDWTEDPFGGGYHAWKAGYDVGATMRFMRRPLPTERIHICGEAYSDQQGWVEGAFCEAEKMLQEYFTLTRPLWLDKDYYLGW